MRLQFLPISCVLILFSALPATAESSLKVVASIKPLHSLVAQVMDGVGEPELLFRNERTAHGGALKPSQAQHLQDADAVFWIGEGLESFLKKPLESIAQSATVMAMTDVEGLTLHEPRDRAHHHQDHDEHDHDKAEGEHEKHDEAGHDEDEEHGHDDEKHEHEHAHEGNVDPHVWLDPANASVLLSVIAEKLASMDPDNAVAYQANAEEAQQRLKTLTTEIDQRLSAVKERHFITFHDALQYFERRYGLHSVGHIVFSPEEAPGAERLADIRSDIAKEDVRCVFLEPGGSIKLADTVLEGTEAKAAIIDPAGLLLDPGPDHYQATIQTLTETIADCLAG